MVDFWRDLMKVTIGNFDIHDDKCFICLEEFSYLKHIADYNKNFIFPFYSLAYFCVIPFQSYCQYFSDDCNFIAFLLTRGKELSFISAPQKEQKSKTIVGAERRLLNICIFLLFRNRKFVNVGGVLILFRLSFYVSSMRHLSLTY